MSNQRCHNNQTRLTVNRPSYSSSSSSSSSKIMSNSSSNSSSNNKKDKYDDGTKVPRVVLRHPLPKMDSLGSLFVYGHRESKHLVIMCAGFPDNHSAFATLAYQLAQDCNCLVGVTCPPGYDDSISLEMYPDAGFTFDDWPVAMREAVKCLRSYSTHPNPEKETTLTGVFHDWGVVAGGMYTNQCLEEKNSTTDIYTPDRIVMIDVLMFSGRQTPNRVVGQPDNNTPYDKFARAFYTGLLAITFMMSRFLPFVMTLSFYTVGSLICRLLHLFPLSSQDVVYMKENISLKSMSDLRRFFYIAYPYKLFWQMIFQGKIKEFIKETALPSDLARTPVLHLYGTSKPYMLSDANTLLQLQQEESNGRPSRVVKVDDAGHWLYVQKPEVCLDAFQSFFHACGIKSS
jgi:pimeloyl-ACP methyl ester carboxylesterase